MSLTNLYGYETLSKEERLEKIEYIDVDLIESPSVDVRFYRSQSFIDLLAKDIEKESFPTPVILRRRSNGSFDPIDGFTRVLAYRKLGRPRIPSIIVTVDDDVEATWKRLKLGINHRDIDPVGVAETLLWFRNRGIRQKDVCARLHWSKGYVSKLLKIARHLSKNDKLRLAKGELTIEQAYSFVSTQPYEPHKDVDAFPSHSKLKCVCCGETFDRFELNRVCYRCLDLLRLHRRKPKAKQKRLVHDQQRLAKKIHT